ncbi:hypothetical protein AAHA92_23299 [Salvia divinorum]|uniref:Uncharacterized protein n=1 Tax=Salvia divinorum TaxID=28513 RepID=A0ABD1GRK1_SALDI
MAYEAVESLQQTLRIILLRDDGLITPLVKQRIISIHDKAVGLQLNLKHFSEKEIIREVANASEEIIQFLFSPQNLSDCESIDSTVRLSDQLGELAEELESTVGYVIDYCKINGHSVRQQSDVAVGFDEGLSDSTAATSSSGPASTSRYFVADFAEDPSIYPPMSRDDVLLKKLELNGRWISWKDMTIVGSLPNLQVLKLKNYACYGEQWATTVGEFRKLILLLIDESNLKHWKARGRHFPMLKCLILHRCPYLDEIPEDIGNIPTLELIEIDDHNQSLLHSANKIQATHKKDRIKVVVKRS